MGCVDVRSRDRLGVGSCSRDGGCAVAVSRHRGGEHKKGTLEDFEDQEATYLVGTEILVWCWSVGAVWRLGFPAPGG